MKIHPREKLVDEAEAKLRATLIEVNKELTRGEYLQVLSNVLARAVNAIAKFDIRMERHGDADKPGGLA